VVLDVVEGSAMEALPLMPGIIGQRPSSFGSVEEAIEWQCVFSPPRYTNLLGSLALPCPDAFPSRLPSSVSTQTLRSTLSARLSVPSTLCPVEPSSSSSRLTWKTDLLASSPFWESWYQGLSSKFLATRSARMLVLAGQDRMDQPLMIGQMQGALLSLSPPHSLSLILPLSGFG
jgi:protein phosphatase methylesterase 1